MKNYLLPLFLCLSSILCSAQLPHFIQVESDYFMVSNEKLAINSTVTITDNELSWLQHGSENVVSVFSIKSTSGSWDQTLNSGEVTFDVSLEGMDGTFKIYNSGNTVVAELKFLEEGLIKFNVKNIEY